MTRRERSLLVGSLLGVVVALAGGAAIWFALTRERTQPPPEPPPPTGPKTTADLLVGKWKRVRHTVDGHPKEYPAGYETTIEYFADGQFTQVTINPAEIVDPWRGHRVSKGTYRLEGNRLRRAWAWGDEYVFEIESITEDRLVVVRRFWRLADDEVSLENAQEIARIHKVPVEQIIQEGGQEVSVGEYVRVPGK